MTPEMHGSDLSKEQKVQLGKLIDESTKIEDYSVGSHQLVLFDHNGELFLVEADMNYIGKQKFIFGSKLREELRARGLLPEGIDVDEYTSMEISYR